MRKPYRLGIHLAAIALVGLSAALCAEDAAKPPVADPAAPTTAPTAAAPVEVDPTIAIVAEGQFVYFQRDLDAFLAIAKRHNNNNLSRAEEDQLRRSFMVAFTAREPLLQAIAAMPQSLPANVRDQIVLDLLDFQADPMPPKPLTPTNAAPQGDVAAATPQAGPAAVAAVAALAAPAAGPTLVRLPPLRLARSFTGKKGEQVLNLGLAFSFSDPALVTSLETQSPRIQDAILGYLHSLSFDEFTMPNQPAMKAGLEKAIQAQVPTFPTGAILIPELDNEGAPAP